MQNYRKINPGQSYGTIGREITGQLRNPPLEIKFAKLKDTRYRELRRLHDILYAFL